MALDHITLVASDLSTSLAFYDAALAPLGLGRVVEFPDEEEDEPEVEAVGYGAEGSAVLWVVAGPESTRDVHVAFTASDGNAVEQFFNAAVANGGRARQAPRRWEIYRPGYFGALVSDPDGNLVEAVASEDG